MDPSIEEVMDMLKDQSDFLESSVPRQHGINWKSQVRVALTRIATEDIAIDPEKMKRSVFILWRKGRGAVNSTVRGDGNFVDEDVQKQYESWAAALAFANQTDLVVNTSIAKTAATVSFARRFEQQELRKRVAELEVENAFLRGWPVRARSSDTGSMPLADSYKVREVSDDGKRGGWRYFSGRPTQKDGEEVKLLFTEDQVIAALQAAVHRRFEKIPADADDLITHRRVWRSVFEKKVYDAPSADDALYWTHELRAFDKAMDASDKLQELLKS